MKKAIAITLLFIVSIAMIMPGNIGYAGQQLLVDNDIYYNRSFVAPNGESIVYSKSEDGKTIGLFRYNVSNGGKLRINSQTSIPYLDAVTIGASNHYACWLDTRHIDSKRGGFDVYVSDLATGNERRITTQTAAYWNLSIKGNWLVWIENYYDPGLYIQDFYSGNGPVKIATINKKANISYSVFVDSGNQATIAWQNPTSTDFDICIYTSIDKKTRRIGLPGKTETSPRISNGKVYFTESDIVTNSNYKYMTQAPGRVKSYNLSDNSVEIVTEFQKGSFVNAAVSSDTSKHVLLSSSSSSGTGASFKLTCGINALDTQAKIVKPVLQAKASFSSNALSNGNFVCSVKESKNSEVYLYMLDNNTYEKLSSQGVYSFQANVSNSTASWVECPLGTPKMSLYVRKF